MEALKQSLSEMAELFTTRMTAFEEELQKAPTVTPSTGTLAAEFATFRDFIMTSLSSLQQQVEIVARGLDHLEMRSRRKMLLFHGVSEEDKEDPAATVAKVIATHLKLESFEVGNIKRCHRMGRPTSSQKPRPLLVKLHDVEVRDVIWFAKTRLKGTGVTVSEFLTKARHSLFMAARDELGVDKAWTRAGEVFALGPDGSRLRISTAADLSRLNVQDKPATAVNPVKATLKPRQKRPITRK